MAPSKEPKKRATVVHRDLKLKLKYVLCLNSEQKASHFLSPSPLLSRSGLQL